MRRRRAGFFLRVMAAGPEAAALIILTADTAGSPLVPVYRGICRPSKRFFNSVPGAA
jgi:hypothetical protein